MGNLLFLGGLGMGELVVIVLIVLLLFGGKKIPELMKGIGKGVKSFKDGVKGIEEDINATNDDDKKSKYKSMFISTVAAVFLTVLLNH